MSQNAEQVSLGPGPLDSAYQKLASIQSPQWKAIDDFVNRMTTLDAQERQIASTWVNDLPKLYQACTQWNELTRNQINQVGSMVIEFNNNQVKQQYKTLDSILSQLNPGQMPSKEDQTRFNQCLQAVIAETASCEALALNVTSEVSRFINAIELCRQEIQSHLQPRSLAVGATAEAIPSIPGLGGVFGIIQKISSMLTDVTQALSGIANPPLKALEQIKGGWAAVRSDLGFTQTWVNQQISLNKPFISDLNVMVAINQWQGVADKAQQFSQQFNA